MGALGSATEILERERGMAVCCSSSAGKAVEKRGNSGEDGIIIHFRGGNKCRDSNDVIRLQFSSLPQRDQFVLNIGSISR